MGFKLIEWLLVMYIWHQLCSYGFYLLGYGVAAIVDTHLPNQLLNSNPPLTALLLHYYTQNLREYYARADTTRYKHWLGMLFEILR